MSFDVDMDGVVGVSDLKYAKAYDLDGDGILTNEERQILRLNMAKELLSDKKNVHSLDEVPITDFEHRKQAKELADSNTFDKDYGRLRQKMLTGNIGGSTGTILSLQLHHGYQDNRAIGLTTDHNATSVKTHDWGCVSPNGQRDRCLSRTQLFEQRKIDFRATAALAAPNFKGNESLFRRSCDTSLAPTELRSIRLK